jgi:hypothetical protein
VIKDHKEEYTQCCSQTFQIEHTHTQENAELPSDASFSSSKEESIRSIISVDVLITIQIRGGWVAGQIYRDYMVIWLPVREASQEPVQN